MEVKANKNISRGDEINIIGDNEEVIANIILVSMCRFKDVVNNKAYYESEYNFDIKNYKDLTKYILQIASIQTFRDIHEVHIATHHNDNTISELLFKTKFYIQHYSRKETSCGNKS